MATVHKGCYPANGLQTTPTHHSSTVDDAYYTTSETQSNSDESYSFDAATYESSAGEMRFHRLHPALTPSNLQLCPSQAWYLSVNQRTHPIDASHADNISVPHTSIPSLSYGELAVSPYFPTQVLERSHRGYTDTSHHSNSRLNNQCQPSPSQNLPYEVLSNSSWPQVHPFQQMQWQRDPPPPPSSQVLTPTPQSSSSPWHSLRRGRAINQNSEFLQIPDSLLTRRRSIPNNFSYRSDRPLTKDSNNQLGCSRSRSAGSRQSSYAPTIVEEQRTQAESTLEVNQCSTCKKTLQDERGLK
jgi:hypothetical protein